MQRNNPVAMEVNGRANNNAGASDQRPTSDQLCDLGELEWAKSLSQKTLAAIAERAEWVAFEADEVVIDVGSEIRYVHLVITGRMQATLCDLFGKDIGRDVFVRGSVVGLFALGLPDRSYLQVQATEPTTAIRLTLPDLLQLTAAHPDFQIAMFRLAAQTFKRYTMVDRSRPKPAVVAFVHHSEASRPLMGRLARRLKDLDEHLCVAGDDERWRPDGTMPFRLLVGDDPNQRYEILKDWASHSRLFVDVRADHSPSGLTRILSYADMVLWCVQPQDARVAVDALRKISPEWYNKIRIVWLLGNTEVAPYVPELRQIAERDFKLALDMPGSNNTVTLLERGFERLVHHLRGIQIGLALGGGAARGMAHLGVLKALEEHGISVDMIAGTSAGAMAGTLYAAGLDPEFTAQIFETRLRPSWVFRLLRSGGYLYLLYKYRRNLFEPMLREYLHRLRVEQLILPMHTIAVDLVEGQAFVRETGDATTGILESINLPPLSLPIFERGHAIVDGGLLNNIPADVLVAKGCNFVIASSVTAKLEKEFFGIQATKHSLSLPFLSTLRVIMRQTMVQDYNMNSVGVQPADFVIAPDVTSFDMSEFTRAVEMARIGEAATDAAAAALRKMLNRLDPKLFATS